MSELSMKNRGVLFAYLKGNFLPLLPLIGLIVFTLPADFILGEGSFWKYLVSDRAQHVAGYLNFVQDGWRSNILSIPNLSIPEGTTVINSDSIPLVSLLGKSISWFTGSALILYGFWYCMCWFANGWIAILIARQFGILDVYRLSAIALLFGSMPFWLMRWYHMSLLAHFLILLGFLAYFYTLSNKQRTGKVILIGIGIISALIHPYLWAMTMVLGATTALVLIFDEKIDKFSSCSFLLLFVFSGIGSAFFVGYFNLVGSSENTGYRHFSTNLLSLVYSNRSFLFPEAWVDLAKSQSTQDAWPFFSNQRPDVTGGQYEGMVYLGLGGLLLLLFAFLSTTSQAIVEHVKKHWVMIFSLTCIGVFAVSPLVSVGPWYINLWVPGERISSILSIFRASGRFFWPVAYFVLIGAMVLVCRNTSHKKSTILLLLAAALQIADTTPMRWAIAADATSGTEVFPGKDWESRFHKISKLIIIPSYECGLNDNGNLKSFVQAFAAFNGVIETNSASQARKTKQCETDYKFIENNLMEKGSIYLFFDNEGDVLKINNFLRANQNSCHRFERGWYCRL